MASQGARHDVGNDIRPREQSPSLRATGGHTLTSYTQPIGETSSDGSRSPDVLFEIALETGGGSWETLQVLRGQLPAVVARDFAEGEARTAGDGRGSAAASRVGRLWLEIWLWMWCDEC